MRIQIVIDTKVFVSAFRSRQGASFKLLSLVDISERFEINLSVPLVLEYEDVANRHYLHTGLSERDVTDVLDYLCSVANLRKIYFLWRPFLRDPKDDMILELAVESQSAYIVSFNKKDFADIGKFGIRVLSPKEFLSVIGEIE